MNHELVVTGCGRCRGGERDFNVRVAALETFAPGGIRLTRRALHACLYGVIGVGSGAACTCLEEGVVPAGSARLQRLWRDVQVAKVLEAVRNLDRHAADPGCSQIGADVRHCYGELNFGSGRYLVQADRLAIHHCCDLYAEGVVPLALCCRARVAATTGIPGPGVAKCEATEASVTGPGIARSTATEPGVSRPGVAKSSATESGVTTPGIAKANATEPGIASPGIAKSTAAESSVTGPEIAKLGAIESSVSCDTGSTVSGMGRRGAK